MAKEQGSKAGKPANSAQEGAKPEKTKRSDKGTSEPVVSRMVVFRDASRGHKFLVSSTISPFRCKGEETYEGKSYPAFDIDISSLSHPAWTGATGSMDTEGHIVKFQNKYAKLREAQQAAQAAEEATKENKKPKPKRK